VSSEGNGVPKTCSSVNGAAANAGTVKSRARVLRRIYIL
jgi:hypothetical protein